MASTLFFDPIKLLRLAPLISNTFSLMFSWDQQIFFRPFILPPLDQKKANAVLPTWFGTWFKTGISIITVLYSTTMGTALANVYWPESGAELKELGTDKWYLAGFVFALSHMIFARRQVGLCVDIYSDKRQGQSTKDMASWLNGNLLRTWITDTPAWLCFFVAVMSSLSR